MTGDDAGWVVLYEVTSRPGTGPRCERCLRLGLRGEDHSGEPADVAVAYGWTVDDEFEPGVTTIRCGELACVPTEPPVTAPAQGDQ